MTLAQRDQVLDWLGRGWPPSKVRDALREAGGPTVALPTVVGYLKRHAEEVAMNRAAWMARLRDEPLANSRDRLRELAKMYGTSVLSLYGELCPACGGEGTLPILRQPVDKSRKPVADAEPVLGGIRCDICRGRKWILPKSVQAVVATTGEDIRLDTLPTRPPAVDPEGLEALRSILRQIREEVGDVWSPREQSAGDGPPVQGEVNMVVISGSKEEYIAKLRALRGAAPLPPPSGSSTSAPVSSSA